jgi:hypothetical protein
MRSLSSPFGLFGPFSLSPVSAVSLQPLSSPFSLSPVLQSLSSPFGPFGPFSPFPSCTLTLFIIHPPPASGLAPLPAQQHFPCLFFPPLYIWPTLCHRGAARVSTLACRRSKAIPLGQPPQPRTRRAHLYHSPPTIPSQTLVTYTCQPILYTVTMHASRQAGRHTDR